jgi:hypothetical protein
MSIAHTATENASEGVSGAAAWRPSAIDDAVRDALGRFGMKVSSGFRFKWIVNFATGFVSQKKVPPRRCVLEPTFDRSRRVFMLPDRRDWA